MYEKGYKKGLFRNGKCGFKSSSTNRIRKGQAMKKIIFEYIIFILCLVKH